MYTFIEVFLMITMMNYTHFFITYWMISNSAHYNSLLTQLQKDRIMSNHEMAFIKFILSKCWEELESYRSSPILKKIISIMTAQEWPFIFIFLPSVSKVSFMCVSVFIWMNIHSIFSWNREMSQSKQNIIHLNKEEKKEGKITSDHRINSSWPDLFWTLFFYEMKLSALLSLRLTDHLMSWKRDVETHQPISYLFYHFYPPVYLFLKVSSLFWTYRKVKR